MDNILKDLYIIKRDLLVLENYENINPFVDELVSEFNKNWNSSEFEWFNAKNESVRLSNVVFHFKLRVQHELSKFISIDDYELISYKDYEEYTDDHHHRKFWNEIEDDALTHTLLMKFDDIIHKDEFDEVGTQDCVDVDAYDFADYAFRFKNLEQAESFIKKYGVIPCSVYEVKDGMYEELYTA